MIYSLLVQAFLAWFFSFWIRDKEEEGIADLQVTSNSRCEEDSIRTKAISWHRTFEKRVERPISQFFFSIGIATTNFSEEKRVLLLYDVAR